MIIFYITYITAIFLAIFCPEYIVDKGSGYNEPLTLGTLCLLYIVVGGVWWMRKYRHHPVIGPIYYVVKMFFIVLFATLMYGFVKEKMKDEVRDWIGKK